jgi:hypothetical protein
VLVSLIDRLRCPHVHADTWLVAAATRTAHRRLLDATLGCPECGAEFELRDGELWLGETVASDAMANTEDEAVRLAALLKLEERGLYLLDGGWCSLALELGQIVEMDLLLADPCVPRSAAPAGQGTLRGIGDRWPLASASLHGIALDRTTTACITDAVRVLRSGGRLVGRVSVDVPAGTRELARDERHWVAEKVGDVIPLIRARR